MCTTRIDISPVKLKHQKPVTCAYFFVELHDRHIRYAADFEAEEPISKEDLMQGWELVHNKIEIVVSKSAIVGFELAWNIFNRKWSLYIFCNGTEDLRTFFSREEEATAFRDKLLNWLTWE